MVFYTVSNKARGYLLLCLPTDLSVLPCVQEVYDNDGNAQESSSSNGSHNQNSCAGSACRVYSNNEINSNIKKQKL